MIKLLNLLKYIYNLTLEQKLLLFLPIILICFAFVLVKYYPHPICLWKNIFHIDCLGCGMTRALCSVLKLDFKTAYNYNPRIFIILPIAILLWFKEVYKVFYTRM